MHRRSSTGDAFFYAAAECLYKRGTEEKRKRKVGGHPMLHKEDKKGFALREREFGRQVFFPGEQSKKGSNVHIEVCVEVGAYVEKLVRMTHVLGEDGDKKNDGAWLSRWSTKGPC